MEYTKLFRNLELLKATGPDGIPARLLWKTAWEITPAVSDTSFRSLDPGPGPRYRSLYLEKSQCGINLQESLSICHLRYPSPSPQYSAYCAKISSIVQSSGIRLNIASCQMPSLDHSFRKWRSFKSQLIITINDLAKDLDDDKSQIDLILLDLMLFQ